jgi:predicted RNA binding protein YcfA (HicA-like mRNA interferase family)
LPRLRRLSGDELVSLLAQFGFVVHSQRGNHAKLRRITAAGTVQTLTVPRHRDLDVGTIHAIFRQAGRFVPEDELREAFFVD